MGCGRQQAFLCLCVCVCVCKTHVKVKTGCLHVVHLHQPVESTSAYFLSVDQVKGCQILAMVPAMLQGVFTPILH